ncbi:AfsR/SARP family transcriptional regulator [Streptomyces subrutilus]|uniref:AfsR/SARP family transcriptional regulator n=1 Tax=Streptomyces subrutilus TaxID=36818 RepID=UPI002E15A918|nr:AfsR/SARP family transcriptional regulator [Streptomyces subrutilus]
MRQEPDTSGASGLRFRMLGPMTARDHGGTPLALGPNQQRALLAVLLLRRGRTAPMADLCEALWGERVPPRAVGTLRTYVSRLRSLFEPDRPARAPARLLLSAPDGYALRLRDPVLDIDEFERGLAEAARLRTAGATGEAYRTLGGALGLWSGTPLSGLPGPYAEAQRDRLTELWLNAREDHFHSALELGLDRDIAAVAALRAFAAEHPLRERTQALLMLALHRAGRPGEALAVYEATRRTLDLELGVPPGPELAALHRRLRSREPGSGPGPGPAAAGPGPARTPAPVGSASPARPSPPAAPSAPVDPSRAGTRAETPDGAADRVVDGAGFVGRAVERALLVRMLGDTNGAVPVAVVTGMPGIGKTALAEHVAERLRGAFPDGVLRASVRDGGAEALTGLVRALGVPGPAVPDGLDARAALYRSLLAGRRVLAVLDDAHDTAGLLPLLPATPGCAALVTSTGRGLLVPGARLVDVPELDDAAALDLLAATAGPERRSAEPEELRRLARRCAGLPLALSLAGRRLRREPGLAVAALAAADGPELLAALCADGASVGERFDRSLALLTPAAARALRCTAGAPDGFGHTRAAELIGTCEAEAADAIDELVDSGLLRPGASGSYRYHPLVRAFARSPHG